MGISGRPLADLRIPTLVIGGEKIIPSKGQSARILAWALPGYDADRAECCRRALGTVASGIWA
jgi:hypothetical protein